MKIADWIAASQYSFLVKVYPTANQFLEKKILTDYIKSTSVQQNISAT